MFIKSSNTHYNIQHHNIYTKLTNLTLLLLLIAQNFVSLDITNEWTSRNFIDRLTLTSGAEVEGLTEEVLEVCRRLSFG